MEEKITQETIDFLTDIIKIPSERGNDGKVNKYIYEKIKDISDFCELHYFSDDILKDPDYAFPLENHTYKDTPNLYAKIKGTGNGKTVVFNTHVDVVPPSPGQDKAFEPFIENGVIYGRGACDAKGQVAALYALIKKIKSQDIKFKGDIIFNFVIEEECGGNGTLAAVRNGLKADAAIILEPSELAIIPAVRGAVWFEINVFGKSGHSGRAGDTVNAIKLAYEAIQILENYHDKLLASSKGFSVLFDQFLNPMPVTFGELQSGNWPATTPSKAKIKGVFGFLPNKNRFEVMKEMKEEILKFGSDWLKNNFELKFNMLHSDGNVISQNHPLVTNLVSSVKKYGYEGKVTAMTASCDAWQYNNILNIPSVVFGPGSLKYAHSKEEHILIKEIMDASDILLNFLTNYCN